MQRLLVIMSVLFFAACASSGSQQVTVHTDEFSKEIQFNSPRIVEHSLAFVEQDIVRTWQIKSLANKNTLAVSHYLVVDFSYYIDLQYFKFAADDTAKSLKVIDIYRKGGHCGRDNCLRTERIAVVLSDADLRKHAATGYRIRISSKSGREYMFTLTPSMIRMQLDTVDQYVRSHSKN